MRPWIDRVPHCRRWHPARMSGRRSGREGLRLHGCRLPGLVGQSARFEVRLAATAAETGAQVLVRDEVAQHVVVRRSFVQAEVFARFLDGREAVRVGWTLLVAVVLAVLAIVVATVLIQPAVT